MAKAKSKRAKAAAQHKKFEWRLEEWASLLAWTDHCLKFRMDFKDTIVDHLKREWAKDFTWERVDNKLKSLWNKSHRVESKTRRDMVRKGTTCLDLEGGWLNWEEKGAIKNAKARLEANPILPIERTARMASTGHYLRNTTSISTTIGPESERDTSLEPPIHLNSPKKLCQVSIPTGQSRMDPERESRSDSRGHKTAKRRAIRDLSVMSMAKKPKLRERRLPEQGARNVIPDSEDASVESNENVASTNHSGYQDIKERISPHQRSTRAHSQSGNGANVVKQLLDVIDDRNSHLSSTEIAYTKLRKTVIEQEDRIADLSQQLRSCRRDLNDHIRCWKTAQTHQDPVAALSEAELTISRVERDRTEARRLARFTQHGGTDPAGPPTARIVGDLYYIANRCEMVFRMSDGPPPHLPQECKWGTDTEALIFRSLDMAPDSTASAHSLLAGLARDIRPQNLVRALTAAAVSEWVFESSFPCFDEEGSRLLGMYRRHLAIQEDGILTVRNLDFAAYHSLIQEDHFQTRTIKSKAEELTIRLSQALAPFFSCVAVDIDTDGFETWGQDKEDWMTRKDLSDDWFERALRLKADLLTSNERYEMVAFHPGAPFDAAYMRVETTDGAKVDPPLDGTAKVKLCVFPALFSYPREEILEAPGEGTMDCDISRIIGQHRKNFIRRTVSDRKGASVLTKAVVLLEDRPSKSFMRRFIRYRPSFW